MGQADVFPGVGPGAGVETGVFIELPEDLAQGQSVFGAEIQSEPLVELGDDLGERFKNFLPSGALVLGQNGGDLAAFPLERDPAASCLPDAV